MSKFADFLGIEEDRDSVTDNTENRCFVDTAFIKYLLPAIRQNVTQEIFMFLDKQPQFLQPQGYRKFYTDPVKTNIKLFHPKEKYPDNDTLPGANEFANLYFENPDPDFDLVYCGDVRKFLNLVSRVGCFSMEQAKVAYNLKKNYEYFVHNEMITDHLKKTVYEDVVFILDSFNIDDPEICELHQAWALGANYFMKSTMEKKAQQHKYISKSESEDDLYYSDEEEDSTDEQSPRGSSELTNLSTMQDQSPIDQYFDRSHVSSEATKSIWDCNSSTASTSIKYSAAAKKAPEPAPKPQVALTKKPVCPLKPNHKYPVNLQVMFGPIPGSLDQDKIYPAMKNIFQSYGDIHSQYIPQEAFKENGKPVKYGMVVFKREKDALKVLNEKYVRIMKNYKINLMKA